MGQSFLAFCEELHIPKPWPADQLNQWNSPTCAICETEHEIRFECVAGCAWAVCDHPECIKLVRKWTVFLQNHLAGVPGNKEQLRESLDAVFFYMPKKRYLFPCHYGPWGSYDPTKKPFSCRNVCTCADISSN